MNAPAAGPVPEIAPGPLDNVPACRPPTAPSGSAGDAHPRASRRSSPATPTPGPQAGSPTDPNDVVPFPGRRPCRAGGYAGVGYVFAEDDPYAGVDLDECRDPETGAIASWHGAASAARQATRRSARPRPASRSSSRRPRSVNVAAARYQGGRVEVYDHKRFFTVTGACLDEYPADVMPRQEELADVYAKMFGDPAAAGEHEADPDGDDSDDDKHDTPDDVVDDTAHPAGKLRDDQRGLGKYVGRRRRRQAVPSRSGAKFADLWAGRWDGRYDSHSEADSALVFMLAFYTKDRVSSTACTAGPG